MKTQLRAVKRPFNPGGMARLLLVGIVTCGCVAGCSDRGVKAVDAVGARQALRTTLETWKKGGPIGSLKEQTPSIVAQDLDWEAGATLVEFNVLDDGKDESINLRIPVELTLQDKDGKDVRKKKVKYMVGTSPVITVFREIF
jgi:hypothetical protein